MKIMNEYNPSNGINKIDALFVKNIENILLYGCCERKHGEVRPTFKDGTDGYAQFLTNIVEEYDISKGEFPLTSLRKIAVKSGIEEMFAFYQEGTNDLKVMKDKFNISWWDEWEVNNSGTIGSRYGHTVNRYNMMKNLLEAIENRPLSRRHIMNLWQEEEFKDDKEGLKPCAFMTMWSYRDGYLDLTLTQRSSDYLIAGHINKMQYVALLLMVARHTNLKPGKFTHYVQNLHIYNRHMSSAGMLVANFKANKNRPQPKLILKESATNFWDMTIDDFIIKDYEPSQFKGNLELAL